MHEILKTLFDDDTIEHAVARSAGTAEYDAMRARDFHRRTQVHAILKNESLDNPIDLYHAAWILNHGDTAEDAKLAYRLAERAHQSGYEAASWLFAAAFDRFCMYSGKAQKFGTQIVPDGQRYRLWDVDPETTDTERERYNVPSLREMLERAEQCSRELEQPPITLAPTWLHEAIARWEREEIRN